MSKLADFQVKRLIGMLNLYNINYRQGNLLYCQSCRTQTRQQEVRTQSSEAAREHFREGEG